MLFHTYIFFLFFFIVYGLYLILNHRGQNCLLLLASYFFYAMWDWRFLSLIVLSTIVDYLCGKYMSSTDNECVRKKYLWISVGFNLLVLGFFKYFHFFVESTIAFCDVLGFSVSEPVLNVILPMGISFYTFQTMSYSIDIYLKKIKATDCFLNFALFVSFFPQLVAGPIERAKRLLPQIQKPRVLSLSQFYEGWHLIFWGLFLKMYVADNLAKMVDFVFSQGGGYEGFSVLMATYAFAFQLFCDFAGYSCIARGLCKTMGFDLMVNFNLPYFSKSPQEFWSRWHISLSTWLRDYLYIPLGGNRCGEFKTCRNLLLTMVLGGIWHGASWMFILWGVYHGIVLVIYRKLSFIKQTLSLGGERDSFFVSWGNRIVFFHIFCFGLLMFRAQSLSQMGEMIQALLFQWDFTSLTNMQIKVEQFGRYVWLLWVLQLLQFGKGDLMAIYKLPTLIKSLIYFVCFCLVLIFGETGGQEFIYFQF